VPIGELAGLGLGVERTDELGRRREGGVVRVHDDAGDDRDAVLVVDEVVELHLEHVADLALRLRVEDVERIRRRLRVRVAHERQQPNLRAVAVRDHEVVAQRSARQDACGIPRRLRLVDGFERLSAAQQGVAAERHHCPSTLGFRLIHERQTAFRRGDPVVTRIA
jgi:hypothetical protein